MKYCKATVTTTTEFADTLSVVLIDLGSEGVSVADGEEIKRVLREHTWIMPTTLCSSRPTPPFT